MQFLIVLTLGAIIVSLGQAMFAMSNGPNNSTRMVRALTVRISLSVALFALLMIGWHFGLIEPNTMH